MFEIRPFLDRKLTSFISLESFDLGSEAPRLSGVQTYSQESDGLDSISLDIGLEVDMRTNLKVNKY